MDADSYSFAQKGVLGTISDNMITNHYFTYLFGQTPLRNSVAMATPKVLGDQKLFERVCLYAKIKVTKLHLTVSELYKKNAWGQISPTPTKIGLKSFTFSQRSAGFLVL